MNHPERWLTENLLIGRFSYSRTDALAILSSSAQDEGSQALREFFAASLNLLQGAEPSLVEEDLVVIGKWLEEHPLGTITSESDRKQIQEVTARLRAYNSGETGPGLCPDEPATSTPVPTATSTPTIPPTNRPAVRVTATARPTEAGEEDKTARSTPTATASPAPSATASSVPPTSTSQLQPTDPPSIPTVEASPTTPPTPEPTPTSPPESAPPLSLPASHSQILSQVRLCILQSFSHGPC